MPNLQNYVDEARSGLQDPNGKFFTNAELIRWINYGLQLFSKEVHLLKDHIDYVWTAETQEISLATIIPAILNRVRPQIEDAHWKYGSAGGTVLIVSQREVWKWDPDRHASDQTGTPERLYYNIYENKVGLYPTPSDAGTLTLFYSYELADYTNLTDAVDTTFNPWWVDIAAYAIARGMLKDVDRYSSQEAGIANERFTGAMRKAKMMNWLRAHPTGTINFVRDYPTLNQHGR